MNLRIFSASQGSNDATSSAIKKELLHAPRCRSSHLINITDCRPPTTDHRPPIARHRRHIFTVQIAQAALSAVP